MMTGYALAMKVNVGGAVRNFQPFLFHTSQSEAWMSICKLY